LLAVAPFAAAVDGSQRPAASASRCIAPRSCHSFAHRLRSAAAASFEIAEASSRAFGPRWRSVVALLPSAGAWPAGPVAEVLTSSSESSRAQVVERIYEFQRPDTAKR